MKSRVEVLAIVVRGLLAPAATLAQKHAIDADRSTLKVHVYRSSLFSVFAHNHEIGAPIAEGWVEFYQTPTVELRVDARKLRVLVPDLAADTRGEVQKTMEGLEFLTAVAFPRSCFARRRHKNPGRTAGSSAGFFLFTTRRAPSSWRFRGKMDAIVVPRP